MTYPTVSSRRLLAIMLLAVTATVVKNTYADGPVSVAQANIPATNAPDAADAKTDLAIGKLRVSKVLFLGNSITLHGPAPEIGWTGNWGMAASAEDRDYVHLLMTQIARAAGGQPQVRVKNIADFERTLRLYDVQTELKEELAYGADLIIVAIGENAAAIKTQAETEAFRSAVGNLFAELKKSGQPTLLVRSQFWADTHKDAMLKEATLAAGGHFVDISSLGDKATNFARAERTIEHAGVAGHPGDQGMKELADVLWKSIKALSQ